MSRSRRFLHLVAAILLWQAWHASAGDSLLGGLASRLEHMPTLHADFVQNKRLQALSRPLRTSGTLVFARDKGVLWRIEKPYQAAYALTPEQVIEIGADGGRKVRDIRDVPALAQVGRVFQALFQGDIKALEAHFRVSATGDEGAWRLELDPKPELARFLKGISVRGGIFLDVIEIREAQGDATRIEFRAMRSDLPLTDPESRLLRGD